MKQTTDDSIRIQNDINMFRDNLETLQKKTISTEQKKIVELATQYYHDAEYYLKKQDLLTSFGCINYAHGLLDAILKF